MLTITKQSSFPLSVRRSISQNKGASLLRRTRTHVDAAARCARRGVHASAKPRLHRVYDRLVGVTGQLLMHIRWRARVEKAKMAESSALRCQTACRLGTCSVVPGHLLTVHNVWVRVPFQCVCAVHRVCNLRFCTVPALPYWIGGHGGTCPFDRVAKSNIFEGRPPPPLRPHGNCFFSASDGM